MIISTQYGSLQVAAQPTRRELNHGTFKILRPKLSAAVMVYGRPSQNIL